MEGAFTSFPSNDCEGDVLDGEAGASNGEAAVSGWLFGRSKSGGSDGSCTFNIQRLWTILMVGKNGDGKRFFKKNRGGVSERK